MPKEQFPKLLSADVPQEDGTEYFYGSYFLTSIGGMSRQKFAQGEDSDVLVQGYEIIYDGHRIPLIPEDDHDRNYIHENFYLVWKRYVASLGYVEGE